MPDMPEPTPITPAPAAAPSPATPPANMHPKVMLIDDDEVWANLITHKFDNEGISYAHMPTGEKALEFFDQGGQADIVLLDIAMPGLDGFEVLKRIKTNPMISEIPVVMMSNFAQEKDLEWGRKLGARKFLDKVSVVPGDVVDVVNDLARRG